MKTVLSSKGRIVLPAALREQDGIQPGQEFEVQRLGRGVYLLKRAKRQPNRGLVHLLLACPVKGWFQPFKPDETTRTILRRAPRFESGRQPGSLR